MSQTSDSHVRGVVRRYIDWVLLSILWFNVGINIQVYQAFGSKCVTRIALVSAACGFVLSTVRVFVRERRR